MQLYQCCRHLIRSLYFRKLVGFEWWLECLNPHISFSLYLNVNARKREKESEAEMQKDGVFTRSEVIVTAVA